MKWRWFASLAVCLCCVALSIPSMAADDVLSVVPKNALGVVVINRLAETNGKIVALTEKLQVPVPDPLSLLKAKMQIQKGVNETGSVAFAAATESEGGGAPAPLLFVPVSDYQDFISQFKPEDANAKIAKISFGDEKSLVARKGAYAVMTGPEYEKALVAVVESKENIAGATSALNAWRKACDAYAIATPAGVKMFQQQAQAGLAVAKSQIPQDDAQGKQVVAGLAMYESLFAALDKEITYAAVGVLLEKDGGIHVVTRTLLADGGVMAKLGKDAGKPAGNLVAGLPAGPYVVAGGGIMPRGWMKPLMDVSWKMLTAMPGVGEMTDEQRKQMTDAAIKSTESMRGMAMRMGPGKANEPLYGDMTIAISVDNARAYLDTYAQAMTQMSAIAKEAQNPLLQYEIEKITVGGKPGLKLSMNIKALLATQQVPQAQQMFEMMFGKEEKFSIYMAAASENTIVGSYLSQESLLNALKTPAGEGLVMEPGLAKTATKLPAGAQWVGFWSPRGTQQFIQKMLTTIVPTMPVNIPEFAETAPIGLAAKLGPQALDTDMYVPEDVLTAGADFVRQVIASQMAKQ